MPSTSREELPTQNNKCRGLEQERNWQAQGRNETLGKESYDKPRQHIKKQRHHFAKKKKVCIVKAMVFPVVMYRYEKRPLSWERLKAKGEGDSRG